MDEPGAHEREDLAELLEAARQRDPYALGQLFDRYYPAVFRYLYFRSGGDEQVCRALAEETFVRLLDLLGRRAKLATLERTLLSTAEQLVARPHKKPRLRGRLASLGLDEGGWWLSAPAERESPIVESPIVESPMVESPLVERPMVERPLVERPLEERQAVEALSAFQRLPAEAQRLLAIRYSEPSSAEKTAGLLGVDVSRAKTLQYQCLIAFSSLLIGLEIELPERPEPRARAPELRARAPELRARALELCLGRTADGEELEAVLASYPQWEAELRRLVEASGRLEQVGRQAPLNLDDQAASRDTFLRLAQRAHIPGAGRGARRSLSAWLRTLVWAGLAIGLAAGLLIGAGRAWDAGRRALPGDLLYPLKLSIERARLSLPMSAVRRLRLESAFEARRVEEIQALDGQRPGQAVSLVGALESMPEAGSWRVAGIQVVVSPQARLVGQVKEGFYVNIDGKLQEDGSVLAERIQAQQYVIEGEVQRMAEGAWLVDSVEVFVTPETAIQGSPAPGREARLSALRRSDGNLAAFLIEAR